MRALCRSLSVLAVSALLVTTTLARGVPQAQGSSATFQSSVSFVALNVSVQDAQSRYVTGLQSSDFTVLDDGVPRDIRVFEATKLPTDLILLLDVSASMSPRMEIARTAARGLLATLREGDRGAVMLFNRRVQAMAGLTADREALANAIKAASPAGDTALHDAVYIALRQFRHVACEEDPIRRQAIVVLSDGEDNVSSVVFDDVVSLARTVGMTIYTVRVNEQHTDDVDPKLSTFARQWSEADFEMRTLARETGALSFFPATEQLPAVYGAIAKDLASQYSVAYELPPAAADGRFHRVTVRIPNRPELRTRTRLGYMSPRDSHARQP